MNYALFNLEILTLLAYYFRESKCFALFNLETLTVLPYFLGNLRITPYLI